MKKISFTGCKCAETCFLLVFLTCLIDSAMSLLMFELEISLTISSLCHCQTCTHLPPVCEASLSDFYVKWTVTYPLHQFDSLLWFFQSKWHPNTTYIPPPFYSVYWFNKYLFIECCRSWQFSSKSNKKILSCTEEHAKQVTFKQRPKGGTRVDVHGSWENCQQREQQVQRACMHTHSQTHAHAFEGFTKQKAGLRGRRSRMKEEAQGVRSERWGGGRPQVRWGPCDDFAFYSHAMWSHWDLLTKAVSSSVVGFQRVTLPALQAGRKGRDTSWDASGMITSVIVGY